MGERKDNVDDQIKYLRILTQFATEQQAHKNILQIQKKIRIHMFNIGTNPEKRAIVEFHSDKTTLQPVVKIYKPKTLSADTILKLNPEFQRIGITVDDSKKLAWSFKGESTHERLGSE